jgi:hypothetical protein
MTSKEETALNRAAFARAGDIGFDADIANRMGPLANGIVDSSQANYVGGRGNLDYHLKGYHVPRGISQDSLNKANTSGRYTQLFDEDQYGEYIKDIPMGKPGEVTGIGNGATKDTFSHEFRHKYADENEGGNDSIDNSGMSEERWNRMQDLMSATSKKEWNDAMYLYADINGSNNPKYRERMEQKAINEISRDNNKLFTEMLDREYDSSPEWYPKQDYLQQQYEKNYPISGMINGLTGDTKEGHGNEAKRYRSKQLYINNLLHEPWEPSTEKRSIFSQLLTGKPQ